MRYRAAALFLAVVLGAAGCSSANAGAAAFVDGDRITEADLDTYEGDPVADLSLRRSSLLGLLINDRVQQQTLERLGGLTKEQEGQLPKLRTAAVQTVARGWLTQLQQAGVDLANIGVDLNAPFSAAALRTAMNYVGVAEKFDEVLIRAQQYCMLLKTCQGDQPDQRTLEARNAVTVQVSPRYASAESFGTPLLPDFVVVPDGEGAQQ